MIYLSFILMFVSNVLWALHDAYRDQNEKVIQFVDRYFKGWHVLKPIMVLMFLASGVISGTLLPGMSLSSMAWFGVALFCAKQSGFEGMYNLINHTARPFDWIRYFIAMIRWKDFKNMPIDFIAKMFYQNRLEFFFYHCGRLHWSEASAVLLFGLYLIGRL
ncbi:MAG TPA: hypothetical protein VMV56_07545 [Williamwhitmania sp.]|nr:hypothetical protein [Williamwhitmania sp.]